MDIIGGTTKGLLTVSIPSSRGTTSPFELLVKGVSFESTSDSHGLFITNAIPSNSIVTITGCTFLASPTSTSTSLYSLQIYNANFASANAIISIADNSFTPTSTSTIVSAVFISKLFGKKPPCDRSAQQIHDWLAVANQLTTVVSGDLLSCLRYPPHCRLPTALFEPLARAT